ncbi:MAG: hypothetical protein ACOC0P_01960 [Planctomycetota bacterium]
MQRKNSGMQMVMVAGAFGIAAVAQAQPVVDGADAIAEYPAPLWVNGTNPTQFGDNDDDTVWCANGSEIDGIRATIADDFLGDPTLFIHIAGNLETNFNKLEVFIDTQSGVGQNQLPSENPDIDFGALLRMGDDGTGNGLTFDNGFTANAYFTMTVGNCDPTGETAEVYASFANLDTQEGFYLGQGIPGDGFLAGGDNPFGIQASVNNSNIAGVTADTADPLLAEAVDTGMEIAIPLFAIGDPTEDILLTIFVNGGGHDFISNQVSGGVLPPLVNPGEPRTTDFADNFGFQYLTVANGTPRVDLFTLHVTPLVGGQQATLLTTGANANQTVYFVYSLRGEGSTFVPQLNVELGLASPTLLGQAPANAAGEAEVVANVPAAASGRTVWLQAAQVENASNVLDIDIQ